MIPVGFSLGWKRTRWIAKWLPVCVLVAILVVGVRGPVGEERFAFLFPAADQWVTFDCSIEASCPGFKRAMEGVRLGSNDGLYRI